MSSERKQNWGRLIGAGLVVAGASFVGGNFAPSISELLGGKEAQAANSLSLDSAKNETLVFTNSSGGEVAPIEIGSITVEGLNSAVERSRVDIAQGAFLNRSGVGSFIFAEPGGLLVGPDFGYQGQKSPYGVNAAGWEAMYEAEGSIQPFSSVTQEVARFAPPLFQNLPEGGFNVFTGGEMTIKIGEITLKAAKETGNTYILAVRGKYPDGQPDSDLNQTVEATEYAPGHFLVEMFQSRNETNLAFISEEWFMQKVAAVHAGGGNCGAEGCSKATLLALDFNTGAFEVWENQIPRQSYKEMVEALMQGEGWTRAYSNLIGGQKPVGK